MNNKVSEKAKKTNHQSRCDGVSVLSSLTFEELVKAMSKALQREYQREFGRPLMFGSFRWIYHNAELQSIEDHSRNRRYSSIYARERG